MPGEFKESSVPKKEIEKSEISEEKKKERLNKLLKNGKITEEKT